jgi:class 3 adenylate cyclase
MRTKTQLLLLTIVGNMIIAGIFLGLSSYREDKQESANLAASASLYQQAWDTMANDYFSQGIGTWHPQTGAIEKRGIWNETSGYNFPEGLDFDGPFGNLLFNAVDSRDAVAIDNVVAEIFAEELDYALVSFIFVLDAAGEILHCASSFEDYGVDPCFEGAEHNFSAAIDKRATASPIRISRGISKRNVVEIIDRTGDLQSTLNDALFIDLISSEGKLGTIVLGKNYFELLESFEYEFRVRTQLSSGLPSRGSQSRSHKIIGLADYFEVEDFSEIGDVPGLADVTTAALIEDEDVLLKTGQFGHLDADLGVAVFGFPLSAYSRVEKAQLLILKDESRTVAEARQDFATTMGIAAAVFALLVGLVAVLTGYAFGGISRAVGVLQSLTKGDLSVAIPEHKGLFRSEDDEVSQLTSAFTNYKNHLVELERVKQSQLEQRKSRDSVIVEKMSSLASQLEGDARKMILKDIEGMERIISEDDTSRSEEESNKMMTYAFTRMSDEVTSLIDARTAEIKEIATKNEELLLNILPGSIVPRMLGEEKTIADSFEECSILFGDIVGFTPMSQKMDPKALVTMLNEIFTKFDDFSDELGLEKIKTIGDSYMVACGVPTPDPDHANKIAEMGLKMIRYVNEYPTIAGQVPSIRVGIHSGPIVAGVIGKRKFIYDLWGDAVNTAARMESHGVPNVIHITEQTAKRLAPKYRTESRGVIDIKGKGQMETFLLYP